ncbi:VOC family protein [Sandaracinobacteroides saxicola]|uniref:VOC family protein n=1 Tax=Sandaracinobacteroides saxicola TaxID=2759707 RepID=A0A7G5IGR8_9SPHN|nr:VOC family protein [Sandaracinobacteroides saxicola]QMW22560.1 VOC family protein [Sandaracinobacteroides saxicola]
MRLATVALLVRDYDEAIAWFTGCLRFALLEDSDLGGGKRWVRVSPPGGGAALLLARAVGPRQEAAIGNGFGGRVGLFLQSDDFWRDYEAMSARGVTFTDGPRVEDYGMVAVFVDLYGNRWDLLGSGVTQEPKA